MCTTLLIRSLQKYLIKKFFTKYYNRCLKLYDIFSLNNGKEKKFFFCRQNLQKHKEKYWIKSAGNKLLGPLEQFGHLDKNDRQEVCNGTRCSSSKWHWIVIDGIFQNSHLMTPIWIGPKWLIIMSSI